MKQRSFSAWAWMGAMGLTAFCLSLLLSSHQSAGVMQNPPLGMVLIRKDGHYPYYISLREETNREWKTYTEWLRNVFVSYPEIYQLALPQDTVTGLSLRYNDPMLKDQWEHPAYMAYPVTGVSWCQVLSYLDWKTDRLNEYILAENEIINLKPEQEADENNFVTEAYLNNQYDPAFVKPDENYKMYNQRTMARRRELVHSGLLFPHYRLPTEQEWLQAEAQVSSPGFRDQAEQALRKRDFLAIWYKHFLTSTQASDVAYQAAGASANFRGGVMEWLIESEASQASHDNEYQMLRTNGWCSFEETQWMDSYGEIREKDSVGRLPFRYVQNTNTQEMLQMGPPIGVRYVYKDSTYRNPYYKLSEQAIDSLLQQQYPNEYLTYQSPLYHLRVPDYKIFFPTFASFVRVYPQPDSLVQLHWIQSYVDHRKLNRRVVACSWGDTAYRTIVKEQTGSDAKLGFRVVLPYTGAMCERKYRVRY